MRKIDLLSTLPFLILVACTDDIPSGEKCSTVDDVDSPDDGTTDLDANMSDTAEDDDTDDETLDEDTGGDDIADDTGGGDTADDIECADRDGDGICDEDDGCPDEPTLVEPTACGCDPSLLPGTFVDSGQTIGSGVGNRKMLVGDLDGDSDLDVFLVSAFHPDEVWLNDGTGTFTDSGARLDSFVDTAGLLADFDQDGDLDVVTGAHNRSSADSRLYLNDGAANFTDSGVRFSTGNYVSMGLGDFNNDSWPDFAVSNYSDSRSTYAYTNNGSGTGFGGVSFGGLAAWAITVGDVNGDSYDDILIGVHGASNQVQLNNGAGGFTGSTFGEPTANASTLSLGDVDADGDLDAVVGIGGGPGSEVWINDGTGAFTDSGQALVANNASHSTIADIDHDGDLDVIFSDMADGENGGARIYLNDGEGLFTLGQHIGVGIASQGHGVGDVNGDGLVDMILSAEFQSGSLYLNTCAAAE